MDALTFDQFLVFVNVVDVGSFSGAARRLNRAQSAITYAMHKLENQIGAELFDRTAYRPVLSEAGRALLPEARRILDDVGRFRSRAKQITLGLEAELHLSVAAMIPLNLLAPGLRRFEIVYPGVRLRITVEPFSMDVTGVTYSLRDDSADIRIVVGGFLPDFLVKRVIGAITLIDVAASNHLLAGMAGPLTTEVLRDHLQIVLSERTEVVSGNDRGVTARNTWRVTDLAAKHTLLLAGIGWGSLPDLLVEHDLLAGRMVRLPPKSGLVIRRCAFFLSSLRTVATSRWVRRVAGCSIIWKAEPMTVAAYLNRTENMTPLISSIIIQCSVSAH